MNLTVNTWGGTENEGFKDFKQTQLDLLEGRVFPKYPL